MKSANAASTQAAQTALDRALQRIVAEIQDGLRHGYFELSLTCEIIGQERRCLTLRSGKSYRFVIDRAECVRSAAAAVDSRDGSDSTKG